MDEFSRIVFCGSHEFAVLSLQTLIKSDQFCPIAVITQPDRPAGRNLQPKPTPIKALAMEYNMPIFQPEDINSAQSLEQIKSLKPDLIIAIAYGLKIKKAVRESAKFGAINLHPSLLPELRGAAPVPFALWQGKPFTGLTIFQLTSKMDAGPIYLQKPCYIFPDENATDLSERLAYIGSQMLLTLLQDWQNNPQQPIPQDETKATYCRKLDKEDCLIDWSKPAHDIQCQIMALAFTPGAYTMFRNKQLKVLFTEIIDKNSDLPVGSIVKVLKNIGIIIQTKDKQLLLKTVQPAGKQIMDAWSYSLGARLQIGERFE